MFREDKLSLKPPVGEPGAPSAAAAVTPDSINMELENIVANTVLLKAREGKDGDGALTAPLSGTLTDTAAVPRMKGCPGHGCYKQLLHFLLAGDQIFS